MSNLHYPSTLCSRFAISCTSSPQTHDDVMTCQSVKSNFMQRQIVQALAGEPEEGEVEYTLLSEYYSNSKCYTSSRSRWQVICSDLASIFLTCYAPAISDILCWQPFWRTQCWRTVSTVYRLPEVRFWDWFRTIDVHFRAHWYTGLVHTWAADGSLDGETRKCHKNFVPHASSQHDRAKPDWVWTRNDNPPRAKYRHLHRWQTHRSCYQSSQWTPSVSPQPAVQFSRVWSVWIRKPESRMLTTVNT